MSEAPVRLPGFWRFAWLFFMQPITLHRLLPSLKVAPDEPFWNLLGRPRSLHERWWLVRWSQLVLLLMPGIALAAVGLAALLGTPVRWLGPVGGVFFVILGVPVGVASSAAVGAAIGVAGGVASGAAIGAAIGVAGGVAGGVAFGVGTGVAFGVAFGVAVGVAGGVAGGVAFGVGTGVASWTGFFRLPILVLEVLLQAAARCRSALAGRPSLSWSPVLYHELSYLPHPFLKSHLLAEADADPALTRRVLEACSIAPGQRRTGRKVEAALRARELKRLAEAKDFQAVEQLRGLWLPGIQGADALLLSFSEAGRYLAAARAAFNPHHRLKHLQGCADQLNAIGNQLRSERNAFTQPFDEPLDALRAVSQEMRAEAQKDAAGLILNPFRAGNPLSGEEGPELFRGRETAVRDIEEILSDPNRTASLLLLAPRRAGKTSLLKMLPRMLPDAICVFFDLQAHPAASVGAFWQKLAEQAAIQAKRERRIELPALPDGPPIEAAAAWLDKLDQLPHRVLIAIDEFERLEDLFPGSRHEFLQLMGLFRATIQHRTGVRLLVSGAAPFEELDGVLDDHFISTRQIRLPFLDLPTSIGLLTQPTPDFPPGTIPGDVAREAYQQTGGQPYLLQIFGSLLVNRLNDEKRKAATLADVQAVEGQALERADTYFRDTYNRAPAEAKAVLSGQRTDLTPAARRWLAQRYLLTPDDRLAIPLFGAWIEHHALV